MQQNLFFFVEFLMYGKYKLQCCFNRILKKMMEYTSNLFMEDENEIILTDKSVQVFQLKDICHHGPSVGMIQFWKRLLAKVSF